MCNFFTRYRPPTTIRTVFRFPELPNDPPRYVVRPTDTERVVAVGKDGGRHAIAMRWGLVPPDAVDIKTGLALFNWRAEDVQRKASYAEPLARGRRCLVPCDGFFEFTGERGAKQPYLFAPRDGGVMAFAGLWTLWRGPRAAPLAEPLLSFSVATTEPNVTVAPYHDRMPVLFTRDAEWDAWLDPAATPETLLPMLKPAADDALGATKISRDLLRIKEPGPEILTPLAS